MISLFSPEVPVSEYDIMYSKERGGIMGSIKFESPFENILAGNNKYIC